MNHLPNRLHILLVPCSVADGVAEKNQNHISQYCQHCKFIIKRPHLGSPAKDVIWYQKVIVILFYNPFNIFTNMTYHDLWYSFSFILRKTQPACVTKEQAIPSMFFWYGIPHCMLWMHWLIKKHFWACDKVERTRRERLSWVLVEWD